MFIAVRLLIQNGFYAKLDIIVYLLCILYFVHYFNETVVSLIKGFHAEEEKFLLL